MESSHSNEPEYCEIPGQMGNAYINSDVGSGDNNSHYQELNNEHRTSNTLYGKLSSSCYPCEVNLAQSKV